MLTQLTLTQCRDRSRLVMMGFVSLVVAIHAQHGVVVTQLQPEAWYAALRNGTVDALVDVRTAEEFGAQWGLVLACISTESSRNRSRNDNVAKQIPDALFCRCSSTVPAEAPVAKEE